MGTITLALLTRIAAQLVAKSVSGSLTPEIALSEILSSTGSLAKEILQSGFGSLRRSTQKELSKDLTAIDIAGIAWADLLQELPDEQTQLATGKPAATFFRTLDPRWFVAWLLSTERSAINININGANLKSASQELSNSIADELGVPDSAELQQLAQRLLELVPERAERIYSTIPQVQLIQTKQLSEQIYKEVSGARQQQKTIQTLQLRAAALIAKRQADVFGRTKFEGNEPPITSLESSYVEPLADQTYRGKKTKDGIQTLLRQFIEAPGGKFAVLHAPFGFGKSLSVREFAARVAEDWQADKSRWFPLVVPCPEILAGHVATLGAALSNVLEASEHQIGLSELSDSKLLVILDGFDEVHQDEQAARGWFQEIRKFCGDGTRRRVVCVSRPTAFRSQWLERDSDFELEILPFNTKQISDWILKNAERLGAKTLSTEKAVTVLGELVSTPILLFMAAYGWHEITPSNEQSPGLSRTQLYRRFLERISSGKWSGVKIEHRQIARTVEALSEVAGAAAFQNSLALVAWEHTKFEQSQNTENVALPVREIETLLEKQYSGIGQQQIKEVTRSICLSMFLKKSDGDAVLFTHRSFREFLTAQHLANELGRHSLSRNKGQLTFILSEVIIKEAEFDFLCDLLAEFAPERTEQLLSDLDGIATESGLLIYPSRLTYSESNDESKTIARIQQTYERSIIVSRNATLCALGVRKVPSRKVSADAVFIYNIGPTVGRKSTRHRIIHHTNYGVIGRIAFDNHTGAISVIRTLDSLNLYQNLSASQPSLFPPVSGVYSDYFAIDLSGDLRDVDGISIYRADAIASWLRAIPKLDSLSVGQGYMEPIFTPPNSLVFPFADRVEGRDIDSRAQLRGIVIGYCSNEIGARELPSDWEFDQFLELVRLASSLERATDQELEWAATILEDFVRGLSKLPRARRFRGE